MIGAVLQTLVALLLVAGMIAALARLARKRQAVNGLMKVVAYQPLGQRKGIAAVQVGSEVLLVGVTPTDLRLLKTLDGPLGTAGPGAPAGDRSGILSAIKERLHAAQ